MSILGAVGNTPLVELKNLNGHSPKVRILAKLEGTNPGGSIKDRPALFMIEAAERDGLLQREKTILEPTSGNTGIALAMIGAAKGYKVKLCMPACVSIERRSVLEALAAEVVMTPAHEGTDGAIREAHRLREEQPDKYFMPNQFQNEANILAHYESTGPEILEQTAGEVDIFVAGMGTTGTLMGVSRCFREKKPEAKVIGIEPTLGHRIQGLKNMKEAIRPQIFDESQLDDKITVLDDDAFDTTRMLAVREGIFVGMSSGAAVAGARKLAQGMESGTIVVVLPDRGDRYLSTALFKPICAKCPP